MNFSRTVSLFLRRTLSFFIFLVLVAFVVGLFWNNSNFTVSHKLFLLTSINFVGIYLIYYRYRYKESEPYNRVQGWSGIFIFAIILCFTVWGFANIYCQLGLTSNTQIIQGDMQTCIYFSALTLVGVSYGDVLPTQDSRLFAASQAILGYFFFALLVSVIIDAFKSR